MSHLRLETLILLFLVEHRVYSTSISSSLPTLQKHCNHFQTASQKLEGATSQGPSTTLHCNRIEYNWVRFSKTIGRDGFTVLPLMGWQLSECRWNFATLTLLISDGSARLPLASHLKLSLMLSGGNYTLIPWCHLELVVSMKWKWGVDWGLSIIRQFSLSISQYTLSPLVYNHNFPHEGKTSSQLMVPLISSLNPEWVCSWFQLKHCILAYYMFSS